MQSVDFWFKGFDDLRIDVFISVEEKSSFLQAGFSLPQAESLVRRMVAAHNETIGPPYLIYAGSTEMPLDMKGLPTNRPIGITIESFSCDQGGDPQVYPCPDTDIACTSNPVFGKDLTSKERVIFRPSKSLCPEFGHAWSLDFEGTDAATVLLHEMGHALGLGHSGELSCPGLTDDVGGAAVMSRPPSASRAFGRDWRRDDIEGLRQIYGADMDHALYTWEDLDFPGNPAESARVPVCADARTPPAVTTAVADAAGPSAQLLAYTNGADQVAHLARLGELFASSPGGVVVDPSEHGISFAPVAVAYSDGDGIDPGRVLIVWSADESKTARPVRLRWAMRDLDADTWDYGYLATPHGAGQLSRRVAVGFDPGNRLFIITSIANTANPYVTALDLGGIQVGQPTVFGSLSNPPFAVDIGKANCFLDAGISRCTIPYVSADFHPADGPTHDIFRNGWFDVEVEPDGAVTLIDDALAPDSADLPSRGMVDLAAGPDGFRGALADWRYQLQRDPGVGSTNLPVLAAAPFPAADWPLRVGSRLSAHSPTQYTLLARRPGILCGNGSLDCDEACDDGNALPDDGCSPACQLESDSATGPDATSGSLPTTGGAPTDPLPTVSGHPTASGDHDTSAGQDTDDATGDGCDCRMNAANTGPHLSGLLIPLLVGRRRLPLAA